MQEQKAENTGRQFCSCFYQLLGIGGSGPTMPGRILGGSCGNVRLFSVPLPPPPGLCTPLRSDSFLSCFVSRGVPLPQPGRVELPRLAFLFPPFASSATCFSPVRFSSPFFCRFFSLLFILRLPRVPRVIGVTLHGALGYVVCPIFTHGKSTPKRRWSLLSFSFPYPFRSRLRLLLHLRPTPLRPPRPPRPSAPLPPPLLLVLTVLLLPFFLHPLLGSLFNKRRSL